MRKVYICNLNSKVDLVKASDFSPKVIPLTNGHIRIDTPNHIYNLIRKHLAESNEDDYLLLSGNAAVAGIISLLWMMKHGIVHFLVWKSYKGAYEQLTIPSFDLLKTLENEPNGSKEF